MNIGFSPKDLNYDIFYSDPCDEGSIICTVDVDLFEALYLYNSTNLENPENPDCRELKDFFEYVLLEDSQGAEVMITAVKEFLKREGKMI